MHSTQNPHGDRLLTLVEAAGILGVGKSTMLRLAHSESFKTLRIGKSIRVPSRCLYEWIDAEVDRQNKNWSPG